MAGISCIVGGGAQPATNAVFVASLDGSGVEQLLFADSPAVYAPPGYLVYVREGTLMAQPFDADTRRLTGDAAPVAEQIASFGTTSLRAFSVSSNRVLAYRTGASLAQVQLAWFDRTGRRLDTLGETADYTNPVLSPDGKRIAVGRRDSKTLTRDVWLFELERGTASRLTFDPADDFNPAFSRDGTRILFTSTRKGPRDIYRKASTGVGEDEPVLESEGAKNVDDWSPDGRLVVYDTGGGAGAEAASDLWVAPLDGDRKPIPFLVRPFTDNQAQVSPDGRSSPRPSRPARRRSRSSSTGGRGLLYRSPSPAFGRRDRGISTSCRRRRKRCCPDQPTGAACERPAHVRPTRLT